MVRIRRALQVSLIVVATACAVAGCKGDPDADVDTPEPPDPGPPRVILARAPAEVRERCREIAADASTTIFCPTRIPPPKEGRRYLGVDEVRNVEGDKVVGAELNYTAKPQRAMQNTFIHMYFLPTAVLPYLPNKSRMAEFGDREGTFYPATGHDPQNNHFEFSCQLGAQDEYWVSVHSIGRGSRQLLDAMVSQLRPVTQ